MGEVYRATDTNLKRTVAIKVLPEAVATEGERLARFQREAEVLARLNHPNMRYRRPKSLTERHVLDAARIQIDSPGPSSGCRARRFLGPDRMPFR